MNKGIRPGDTVKIIGTSLWPKFEFWYWVSTGHNDSKAEEAFDKIKKFAIGLTGIVEEIQGGYWNNNLHETEIKLFYCQFKFDYCDLELIEEK